MEINELIKRIELSLKIKALYLYELLKGVKFVNYVISSTSKNLFQNFNNMQTTFDTVLICLFEKQKM